MRAIRSTPFCGWLPRPSRRRHRNGFGRCHAAIIGWVVRRSRLRYTWAEGRW
nr:MAG TPA: hypothetical protein [Caudoviricetes sp.]